MKEAINEPLRGLQCSTIVPFTGYYRALYISIVGSPQEPLKEALQKPLQLLWPPARYPLAQNLNLLSEPRYSNPVSPHKALILNSSCKKVGYSSLRCDPRLPMNQPQPLCPRHKNCQNPIGAARFVFAPWLIKRTQLLGGQYQGFRASGLGFRASGLGSCSWKGLLV